MPRYFAFLRAVNVGGRTIKMERLRALFEELGFENVETFIASGNVIFEGPPGKREALERKIEQHLEEALGYEVATFIRTHDELCEVAQRQPFRDVADAAEHSLYVTFLREEPTAEQKKAIEACRSDVDELRVQGRELYWLCRTKITDSKVTAAQLGKAAPIAGTMRNMTTVRRLVAKYDPPDA
jgi:uncharacterized protein (DUF1697 family)